MTDLEKAIKELESCLFAFGWGIQDSLAFVAKEARLAAKYRTALEWYSYANQFSLRMDKGVKAREVLGE